MNMNFILNIMSWHYSGLDRKGHCHLVGYQPVDFRSQKAQKERQLQQSGGSLSSSLNQLPADRQVIDIVSEHQEVLSSNQPIVDLPANGVQDLNNEQHVSS